MPLSTAESATSSALVARAITRASVVFPDPGGPQRMIDGTWSVSIASRKSVLGPRMCFCPAISSRVSGRIRSASGALRASFSEAARNRFPLRPRGMYVPIPAIVATC